MARQIKAGLDYFSHDVDIMQDKKIRLIFAKHGGIGVFIYMRLLEELYRDNGYYLQIDEDFNILFSGDNKITENDYINILNDCINKNLFNEKLYKKHKILTSERIQRNYISGTERRKEVNFIKEYLLLKPNELYSDKVNVNINKLNVDINSLNDNTGTQRKEKEKKLNIKENIYYAYPIRGDKKDSLDLIDRHLKSYTKDELLKAVENYRNETNIKRRGFPELKYKNPKTFFNRAILNYLPEYYEEQEKDVDMTKRENCKTQEEWRYYNYLDISKDGEMTPDVEKRIDQLKREMEESLIECK